MATERQVNDIMGKALDAQPGAPLTTSWRHGSRVEVPAADTSPVCDIRTGTSRRYRVSSSAIGSTPHGWSPRVPLAIR